MSVGVYGLACSLWENNFVVSGGRNYDGVTSRVEMLDLR